MKTYYYDLENEKFITEETLKQYYTEEIKNGGEDFDFKAYLNECTGKNGSLEIITEKEISEMKKETFDALENIINLADNDGLFEIGDNAFTALRHLEKLLNVPL